VNTPTCSHRCSTSLRPLHHAHQHHHADVVVEPGVDDQRLQLRLRVALGRRHARDDRLEDFRHALARLGAGAQRVARFDADDVLDLPDRVLGIGGRQVDLVQHRDHLDPLLDRGVAVGDGLRLDALRGVDHQQRALAGRERTADLIGKVDVARRIDEVEQVALAAGRHVFQRRGLRLDGDAALALERHRIEHLLGHLALRKAAAALNDPIGERRLAVVDVSDDGKVADAALRRHEKKGAGGTLLVCSGRYSSASRARTARASSRAWQISRPSRSASTGTRRP